MEIYLKYRELLAELNCELLNILLIPGVLIKDLLDGVYDVYFLMKDLLDGI